MVKKFFKSLATGVASCVVGTLAYLCVVILGVGIPAAVITYAIRVVMLYVQ